MEFMQRWSEVKIIENDGHEIGAVIAAFVIQLLNEAHQDCKDIDNGIMKLTFRWITVWHDWELMVCESEMGRTKLLEIFEEICW